MTRQLTEQTFYKYIKCPAWVYFDAHADEPAPHHPLLMALTEEGLLDAKKQEVLSDREDIASVRAEDQDRAYVQTLEFMRAGRQTIYNAVLIDGHWAGNPDVLEKVEGASELGEYYYVAADIKRARELKDDYKFQGCFYAELLERIQGVKPVQGYVITPDGDALAYLIEEFEAEYKLTLDEIERIIAGERPAHFSASSCKQSPWFEKCHGEAAACDDISLLNRLWPSEARRLKEAGIETIAAFAGMPLAKAEKRVPDLDHERLRRLHDQAHAIASGTHEVKHRAEFPESPAELFFDIESDPLRDFDYLFGVLVVSEEGEEYKLFFAESEDKEQEMWEEFTAFIERYIDAPVYHYGHFELDVIGRFANRFGVSELVREALAHNMIDLQPIVRRCVLFPLPFYSLKDIANYIGFEWRAADANGANSVLWFEQWLETRDKKVFQKLVEYNEDDVRATWKLQRWLRENAT